MYQSTEQSITNIKLWRDNEKCISHRFKEKLD